MQQVKLRVVYDCYAEFQDNPSTEKLYRTSLTGILAKRHNMLPSRAVYGDRRSERMFLSDTPPTRTALLILHTLVHG